MTTAPADQRTMSLLTQLFDDAVRSDYPSVQVPASRPAGMRVPRSAVGFAVVVALVGFILATAALTVRSQQSARAIEHSQLLDRISAEQQQNVALDQEIAARSQEVQRLTDAVLPSSAEGRAIADRLQSAQVAAGYTDVSGPGLTVTITETDRGSAVGRVMDRDLQGVVNGLWAAGATAIAINGIRLTSATAIRSAGDAILVDYRPLTTPYVVTGIGAGRLADSFESGPAGALLRLLRQQYAIDSTVVGGDVVIAASTAELPVVATIGQESS